MSNRFWIVSTAVLAIVVIALTVKLVGGAPGGGRSYTPPRTADGHPALQGVWRAWTTASADLEDHRARLGAPAGRTVIVDPADGKIPYTPAALAKKKENFENSRTIDPIKNADPLAKCFMPGVPRVTYLGFPLQIFQTAKQVEIFYEWTHVWRAIYTDGTPHPPGGKEQWMGDSRGRYEGNTLVVDVADQNPRTWFDMAGNFHSNQVHVVERYTPLDADTLQFEATVDDPKVFTRQWTIRLPLHRQKEVGILDYECYELLEEAGVPLDFPKDTKD